MGLQTAENLAALVVEQAALLSSSPLPLFIDSNNPSGCLGQVLTHMVEIQQIRTLVAKIVAKLINNQRRTVAQPMHVSFFFQTCFERDLSPHPSGRFRCSER